MIASNTVGRDVIAILDRMAANDAVKVDNEYVWIDRKTLRIAAEIIRRYLHAAD